MAAMKKGSWGGPRKGAGRRPGPAQSVRSNRVTFTVTDAELRVLKELADEKDMPLGTLAYEIIARTIRRRMK